jgi:hypothetical protein
MCRSRERCETSGAEKFWRFGEEDGRDKMRDPRYTRPALEVEDPSVVPGGKVSVFLFIKEACRFHT